MGKRKADAAVAAARGKRAKGGIYLSDDEDEIPQPRVVEEAAEEEEEEEEPASKEDKAPSKADDFFASMKQDTKSKSKADDFFSQMMSGKVEKKATSKVGGGDPLAGILGGLVSAKSSSSDKSVVNVASMFPKAVAKKETVVLKELREFAGEKVVIETKVEVGSAEHDAMKKKSKNNLGNLLDKLAGLSPILAQFCRLSAALAHSAGPLFRV